MPHDVYNRTFFSRRFTLREYGEGQKGGLEGKWIEKQQRGHKNEDKTKAIDGNPYNQQRYVRYKR